MRLPARQHPHPTSTLSCCSSAPDTGSPSRQRTGPTPIEPAWSRGKGSFVLGKRVRGRRASLPGPLGPSPSLHSPLWAGGCVVRWADVPCGGSSGVPRVCEQKLAWMSYSQTPEGITDLAHGKKGSLALFPEPQSPQMHTGTR